MIIKRDYSTLFWLCVSACVIIYAVLLGLTHLQGPRIRSLQLDPLATQYNDKLLIARTNRTLNNVQPQDITISPRVGFVATVKGSTIALRFTERLANNTSYTLRIGGPYTLSKQFTTPPSDGYYISHPDKDKAVLTRFSLSDKHQQKLFEHHTIIDYAVLDASIIVATQEGDDDFRLVRIGKQDGHHIESIPLPQKGVIDTLQASPDGKTFGLVLSYQTNDATQSNLLLYDPTAKRFTAAKDLAGKPLETINWTFAPDNTALFVQDIYTTIYRVDVQTSQATTLLGQHNALLGVTADSQSIVVRDQQQFYTIQRNNGNAQEVTLSLPDMYSLSDVLPLRNGAGFGVKTGAQIDGKPMQQLFVVKDAKPRQLVTFNTQDTIINTVNFSPNDQYVGVTVQNRDGQGSTFGYTAIIIDVARGKEIARFAGTDPQW